jgi:hypothetical protein
MDIVTQESLDLMKQALAKPNEEIRKSISVSGTGLVAYDLQAPAKNLYPFITPLRNVIPRVGGGVGAMTNWRQVSAIIGSGIKSMGWVPEGQRSGKMSYTTSNQSASYVTLGEEDSATFEAISAGRTFEDIQAMMAFRLLQQMMIKEEFGLLGGNFTIVLGTPATPTLTHSGTGGTLPAATYSVKVVALTLEGYAASSLTGGVAVQETVAAPDGKTYVVNGGSSAASAGATAAVASAETLFASTTPIQGAVAYAWYVSTTVGAERLEAITTINSLAINTPLLGTGQLVTAVTGDHSANNNSLAGGTVTAFDGILTAALKAGSNAYVKSLAPGVAGTGTTLTASGRGSVTEIDTMFQVMWDTYRLSPTVLYVNSQELKNITSKVLSTASAPLLRYDSPADGSGGEYQITASGVVQYYYNPFAINGGLRIPIRIHPNMPPGTIVGWAENLPIQYQSNEVPNVAEVKTRVDYYQLDWPIVTRERQVGVYVEETLAVYAPFAMGVISNIANG